MYKCDACLEEKNEKRYEVITCGVQEFFCAQCYEYELGVKVGDDV